MKRTGSAPMKVMGATLLGTAIEWYDYGIYVFAAAIVFPAVFFPQLSEGQGLLSSFATLAIAGITRPLGAIIFGHIGDRIGRKRALVLSLVVMTIATVAIGVLPTYNQVGWVAIALLFAARVVQSTAVGGEWGGATLYAVEAAPPGLRAIYGSFPQIGNGLGLLASTGIFTALTVPAIDHLLVAWTWRIPFLLAAVLGAIGIYLRLRLEESPVFKAAVADDDGDLAKPELPVLHLLRTSWRTVLQATGAFLITIAGLYIIVSYVNARGVSQLGYTEHQLSQSGMMVSVAIIVVTPLAAWAADRIGVRRVVLAGLVLHLIVAYPMLWLVEQGTIPSLWLGQFIGIFASSVAYAVIGTLVAGWFHAATRQSGLSLAYQLSGIVGMFTPFVAQYFDNLTGGRSFLPAAALFFIMALISTLSVLTYRKSDLIDEDVAHAPSLGSAALPGSEG